MKIYNEKTKKIEPLKTLKKDHVKMYVCGPTLYSDIHIGNARPIIFFDVVARFLTALGYTVEYVSNITDIDDKIINHALLNGIDEKELVQENLKKFSEVLNKLNIIRYFQQPKVTDYIEQIIEFIKKLIATGYAYEKNGNVYFDIKKVKEYGLISNVDTSNMQVNEQINQQLEKKNPADFTLWKNTAVGITWQSPWSNGRPGWHTECVVMIREILGNEIDIHGGGIDLKFPHHENENAQSLACASNLANYWMHNGFINIDNEKMSKSIGNVVNVGDMLDQYGSNVLRLLMFQTNYRQPINLTDDFIMQTVKLELKLQKLYAIIKSVHVKGEIYGDYTLRSIEYLKDDFNTSNVITLLIEMMKGEISKQKAQAFMYIFEILGLVFEEENEKIPQKILDLVEKRNIAKQNNNYDLADKIRLEIVSHGYEVLDTRNGVECKKV